MPARNYRTEHGTSAGKHRPLEAKFARLLKARMDTDRDNACNNRDRNRPADNLPNRRTLRNHANRFLAREFAVFFDNLRNSVHVSRPHDRHNFLAGSILDLARQELVAFINQHLLDFGERLAEILHHSTQGVLLLDLGEVFFADFRLVEDTRKKPAQQAKLTVPGSTRPRTAQRNLDVTVGKHQFGATALGAVHRFLEFGTRLYASLGTHTLLVRPQHQVRNQSSKLLVLDNLLQVRLFPEVRLLDRLQSTFIQLDAHRIGRFRLDGCTDKILRNLRNMGGAD